MMKKWFAMALCGFVLMVNSLAYCRDVSPSELVNKKKPLVVKLMTFEDASGQPDIKILEFKKAVETAMAKRGGGSLFTVTDRPDISDILVYATIKKFEYSEKDPITSFGSPTMLLLDAATSENYVTMDVEFTVIDTKTNKIIWKNKVTDFKKKMMSRQDSIPIIYDKVARTFLWKCFGRPK